MNFMKKTEYCTCPSSSYMYGKHMNNFDVVQQNYVLFVYMAVKQIAIFVRLSVDRKSLCRLTGKIENF